MTDDKKREVERILQMEDSQFRLFVNNQLSAGAEIFAAMQASIDENTVLTRQVASSTAEIIGTFEAVKKGYNFFSSVGRFLNRLARWAAPILTIVGIVWAIMHGQWPKGGE